MGNFRFYKRMSIFPGLSVNLSKSGPSVTVGMRGAHVTMAARACGKTVGIPGTGIYYTRTKAITRRAFGARRAANLGSEQSTRMRSDNSFCADRSRRDCASLSRSSAPSDSK